MVFAPLLLTAAQAADLPVRPYAKAPPAVYSWNGFYGGVNVGGGWSDPTSASYLPNDPVAVTFFTGVSTAPPSSDTLKSSGVLGGVQFGYNFQFNRNWVAGLETDFQLSGISGSGVTALPGFPLFTSSSEDVKYFGTVRARLGYLATDKLLIYGTGGFAYAQLNHSTTFFVQNPAGISVVNGAQSVACGTLAPGAPPPQCYAGTNTSITPGYTVGGGLEYAL
jgi:outer membrane immunogenic protein